MNQEQFCGVCIYGEGLSNYVTKFFSVLQGHVEMVSFALLMLCGLCSAVSLPCSSAAWSQRKRCSVRLVQRQEVRVGR